MVDKRGMVSSSGQAEPAKALRPLRILVADDDRDTVLTLMMVLRHEGHEVKGVYKGADLIRAATEFEPDALIVDIHMPDVSGYDVARRLADKHGAKPLLIGISGVYKSTPDLLMAKAVGFDHYLVKPCEPSDVLKLLAPLRTQEPT